MRVEGRAPETAPFFVFPERLQARACIPDTPVCSGNVMCAQSSPASRSSFEAGLRDALVGKITTNMAAISCSGEPEQIQLDWWFYAPPAEEETLDCEHIAIEGQVRSFQYPTITHRWLVLGKDSGELPDGGTWLFMTQAAWNAFAAE